MQRSRRRQRGRPGRRWRHSSSSCRGRGRGTSKEAYGRSRRCRRRRPRCHCWPAFAGRWGLPGSYLVKTAWRSGGRDQLVGGTIGCWLKCNPYGFVPSEDGTTYIVGVVCCWWVARPGSKSALAWHSMRRVLCLAWLAGRLAECKPNAGRLGCGKCLRLRMTAVLRLCAFAGPLWPCTGTTRQPEPLSTQQPVHPSPGLSLHLCLHPASHVRFRTDPDHALQLSTCSIVTPLPTANCHGSKGPVPTSPRLPRHRRSIVPCLESHLAHGA